MELNTLHEFAVTHERKVGHIKTLEIDTSKARYNGISWKELGDFGKRKFENILFLKYHHDSFLKFFYV